MKPAFFAFLFFCCFGFPAALLAGARMEGSDPDEGVVSEEDTAALSSGGKEIKETFLKTVKLNFLLRSSLEIPLYDRSQARVAQNEIRLESMADLTPNLGYRVRYRLNRSHAQRSLDNAPGSLDIAFVNYRFGNDLKWDLTVGKQSAAVGSWEFEKNPTFEYQYTDYVNQQLSLFLTGIKLGHKINRQHTFYVQLHNTYNDTFVTRLSSLGYETNGLEASKTPMGVYSAWLGSLWQDRLKTFWSYNLSSFARDKPNHSFSMANKVIFPRFEAYLDLQHTMMGVDFPNIVSPSLNTYRHAVNGTSNWYFAEDVRYRTAVLRADYEFINKWFLTVKGFYESASLKNSSLAPGKVRENYGFWAGIEFKPVESQNMRLFGYYYWKETAHKGVMRNVIGDQNQNLLAFGVLYFVNVL